MDESAQAQALDRLSARLLERSRDRMLEHTMPVHVVHGDGDPIALGSGVLIRIGDTSFLFSCAHVLKRAQEPGAQMLIPSADRTPLVVLGGVEYGWTEDEKIDLGFALLSPDVVALTPPGKKFLRISDLVLNRAERKGVYSVVGYPVETTERKESNINSSPVSFTSYLLDRRVDDHVDGVTIALIREPNATGDSSGDLARMPHLGGISGCGIWRLADMDAPAPRAWSPESHVKLIGIEHGLVRGAIVGSHIAELIEMIRSEFLSLRNCIDLHR